MPRRNRAELRVIEPDPIHNEKLVSQLVNRIMLDGKGSMAHNTVYKALDIIKDKTKEDSVSILKKAVKNVRPVLEVRPRRVGGATYQVPVEVPKRRSTTLAFRWIVIFARARRQRTFAEALANELIDASNNTGSSIKKKQDLHKMAESNRAFAHYRW
jgi:small subunit ribosomal protein S7